MIRPSLQSAPELPALDLPLVSERALNTRQFLEIFDVR